MATVKTGPGKASDGRSGGPAAQSAQYTARDIQVLGGLEAVRRRPGMYIGSTDQRGLHHLVYEITDNAIDEGMAGFCDHVEVVIHDQVPLLVAILPIAPKTQPQAVPAHAGEVGHVLLHQLLPIGVDVARGPVVAGGGEAIVGAAQRDLPFVRGPANHALVVEIDEFCGGAAGSQGA